MVLILSNVAQFAGSVIDELEVHNKRVVFFQTSMMMEGESIIFESFGNKSKLLANIDDQIINLNDAEAVWIWKPMIVKELRISPHARYINMQYWKMWESIASILRDRIWVSDYRKMIEAENKPYQLKLASDMGFTVPDTLITSDPQMARDFWKYCKGKMVIKQLALLPKEDKVIFTVKANQ